MADNYDFEKVFYSQLYSQHVIIILVGNKVGDKKHYIQEYKKLFQK